MPFLHHQCLRRRRGPFRRLRRIRLYRHMPQTPATGHVAVRRVRCELPVQIVQQQGRGCDDQGIRAQRTKGDGRTGESRRPRRDALRAADSPGRNPVRRRRQDGAGLRAHSGQAVILPHHRGRAGTVGDNHPPLRQDVQEAARDALRHHPVSGPCPGAPAGCNQLQGTDGCREGAGPGIRGQHPPRHNLPARGPADE